MANAAPLEKINGSLLSKISNMEVANIVVEKVGQNK